MHCGVLKPAVRRSPSSVSLPSTGFFSTLPTSSRARKHFFHDPAALVDVRQLAAAEQDIDQHLVFVLQELARTLDLDLDVVVAGLGPDPNFLDVNLVLLLLGEFFLLRVLELAVSR